MIESEQQRRQYLSALGIPLWLPREAIPGPVTGDMAATSVVAAGSATACDESGDRTAHMDWAALEQAVGDCRRCALCQTRKQAVFGTGNREARWLFVGEAPGADEDRQGEPFVGRAGKLLNAMLFALGLKRQDVYIANVLKCRPPNNRDPRPEEVIQCEPYLLRQIELLRPGVIIALGRHAAHSLLKTELPLGRLRGQKMDYHHTPLVVTYHPAYLLRNPADKRKVWQDLCLAKRIAEQT